MYFDMCLHAHVSLSACMCTSLVLHYSIKSDVLTLNSELRRRGWREMEGKGNEMAFQLKVQLWQYRLCNENVRGTAEVGVLRGTA